MDVVGILSIFCLFSFLYRYGSQLAKRTGLPSITLCLTAGAAFRAAGLLTANVAHELRPLHQASLAIITMAAGSELELEQLRKNYRVVRNMTLCLTGAALIVVFVLGFASLATTLPLPDSAEDASPQGHTSAASLLAAVVAIARSPSSAIGVVSELSADGPFTQTMLSVTMVTDVVVVVLFTAALEVVDAVLHPTGSVLSIASRFVGRVTAHIGLSLALAAVLVALSLALLRLPIAGALRLSRAPCLLLIGVLAFDTERWLHHQLDGTWMDGLVKIEPMLACIVAGFALCNWCGKRRPFSALLHGCTPAVLAFFFITTGCELDFSALARSWPVACTLFVARLVSIRVGCALCAALTPETCGVGTVTSSPAVRGAGFAWLAYLTQAGVGLGLAEEAGESFPGWGGVLRSCLVATIVLNQVVGPPLLKHALRTAGEAGRRAVIAPDKLAVHLTRKLTDPSTIAAILGAAGAAARAFPSAVAGAAGELMGGGAAGGGTGVGRSGEMRKP